ncbi:DNA gyrase subunit A [Thermoproteota archaeon]
MEPEKQASSEEEKEQDARVKPKLIEEEMKASYLDYAMSVIVGRALPDVRDGLKPVHRRILYAMHDLGMLHNKPFKKSARIVGEVLGKYHPHGDTAVYDAAVRMAQDFSLRYPLIDGQGNFGSVDGDPAAAMRYTEARLAKMAEELLSDIDKDTVDFQPNFDGSLKEPTVLPSKFPNLLVNGSSGIAVGMATNIPPHNLSEVTSSVIELIDNPTASIKDLMKHIKGPDFPTGGIIIGRRGIKSACETGRGKVVVRARAEIEEFKNKERIIISEIPYQVNKALLIEQIADLVKNGNLTGISDIRDESDKDGMRVVIEIKPSASSNVLLNQLYRHTRMESSFGIILLSLVDNAPKVLNIKDMITYFLNHRRIVIRRRTEFDLRKAEERAHILEGLIIALDDIDDVVQKIKKSKDVEVAKNTLMKDYSLTDIQAKAILEMRLQKLSSLEQEKIKEEHKKLMETIAELKSILSSEQRILSIIKDEMLEIREKYGDDRRTEITDGGDAEITDEDLIPEEEMVVTVTHAGYIKRLATATYRTQGRGGKGVVGTTSREEDFVEHLFIASTHDYVLFFTNKGKVYWLKVHELPQVSRQAKGKAIVNMIQLESGERVTAFVPVKEFDDAHFLVMATKQGLVKKSSLELYSRPRKGGIKGIGLNDGDELIDVRLTDGQSNIILATKQGMAIRFKEQDARPMGRTATGVRGIKLKKDDGVIGMVQGLDERTLLTITDHGFGKRTKIAEYRLINRGGVGVKNIICSPRNGGAVAVLSVTDEDDVMFISKNGVIIRTDVKGISQIGRATQGFRLMKINSGDTVVAAAKIIKE